MLDCMHSADTTLCFVRTALDGHVTLLGLLGGVATRVVN